MTMRRDGIVIAAIAMSCGFCCAQAQESQQDSQQDQKPVVCGGGTIVRGEVGQILDGRTFSLADGREVRLAAVEVPGLRPSADTKARSLAATPAPGSLAAKTALQALIGSEEVVLRYGEAATDRYGRIVAFAYARRGGAELFAQGELISSGQARVVGPVGSRTCAAELLQRESAARQAKLGLWADPYYEVLNADAPLDVLAQRGRFALVEGRVVSVRESGATIYVNFGRRWSRDFTVTISKRNERNFTAAGLDLKSLAGRRVRVRGWIEERGGTDRNPDRSPWIEAISLEQIEVADRD